MEGRELAVAAGIVANMSDPAILLDRNFRHVCHSLAFATLAGLRSRQLERRLAAGDDPFALFGRNPARDADMARVCLTSGKPVQFAEQSITNAEGMELIVYLTFLPVLAEDGTPIGLIQTFRDVSAEARVQARYHELLDRERLRAEQLEREVEKRTAELRAALEEVTRLSRVDPLTQLLNRRAFTEVAGQNLLQARRYGRKMGLLIGDLDHFKRVNDTFGHQVGDQLLVATADAIRSVVRETDHVARFGGEEFVVLLTETLGEGVLTVGERIRAAVEALAGQFGAAGPAPTISIGAAIYDVHGNSLDELVSHADQALYRAKDAGRNRVST